MAILPLFERAADRAPASILKACGQWLAEAVNQACGTPAYDTTVEISDVTENYNAGNPEGSVYAATLTFTGPQASSIAHIMKNGFSSAEINATVTTASIGDSDPSACTLTIQTPSRVMRMINRETRERDYPQTENMDILAGHIESVCVFVAGNPYVGRQVAYALQFAFDLGQVYPETTQAHPSFHINPFKGHYSGGLVISTSEPAVIDALLHLNLDAVHTSETHITASVPETKFQQLYDDLQGPAVVVQRAG